jgi:hypothetical protein
VYQGLTRQQAAAKVIPPATDIGILTSDDILVAKKSLEVTSAKWLEPLSYGLMKWNVTVLPAVTQAVYHAFDEGVGHDLMWNTHMVDADLTQYDMVVHVIPTRTSVTDINGNRIFVAHPHGAYGGRPDVMMPADWLDGEGVALNDRLASVKPSVLMLHESLHNYEGYRLISNTGIDHLHGAEVHGYWPGTCEMPNEYICWYKNYMRSQVGEDTAMRFTRYLQSPIATNAVSTYVGIFDVFRYGKSIEQLWSFNKSYSSIQHISTNLCLDMSSSMNGSVISLTECTGNMAQRGSFKHVQHGAYQWVNDNDKKCAEFNGTNLIRETCSVVLPQRFLLEKNANSSYQIKTLNGSCLTLAANNTIATEACINEDSRQLWRLNF